jgi:hypothetical protein
MLAPERRELVRELRLEGSFQHACIHARRETRRELRFFEVSGLISPIRRTSLLQNPSWQDLDLTVAIRRQDEADIVSY